MKQNLTSIALTALLAFAAGYWVGVQTSKNPAACPKPAGLEAALDSNALNLAIEWSPVNGASGYLVIARDTAQLETVLYSRGVSGTSDVIPSLPANRGVVIDVYSQCDDKGTPRINPDPIETIVRTPDWIITEDIVHLDQQILSDSLCQFSSCNAVSPVANTANCFAWNSATSGFEMYRVDILDATSSTVVARAMFSKDHKGGMLKITPYDQVSCGGWSSLGDVPARCKPAIFNTLCGRFPIANGAFADYRILFSSQNFCFSFPGTATSSNYVVRVTRCEQSAD